MIRFLVLMIAWTVTTAAHADGNWASWRGPHADGHTDDKNIPVKWDQKAVQWKVNLPGEGQSSPTIWGDRIFLTTALENGKKRVVLCVDRKKGDVVWQKEVWEGEPELTHKMNGWASATCATDGHLVVAFFGKGGMHAFTVEGQKLWSRDLGPFAGPWGTSACPIIVGDLVIQNCDATEKAAIVALNKKDGTTVWETPRKNPDRGGWSTPVLVETKGRKELIVNGERNVVAYDLKGGNELWTCKTFAGRGEPTVTPFNGLVYVINGLAGDIYAIKPGGKGDITKSHMAWHTPRKGGRDQPSPILIDKYLLAVDMKGVATCYDNVSGKELWKDRLRGAFTGSPIAANGLAYIMNEQGETFVLKLGPKMELVAANPIGASDAEIFRASLTPSNGQLFARSRTHLYCIGQEKK